MEFFLYGIFQFGDVYVLDCADDVVEVGLDFLPLLLLIGVCFCQWGYLAQ